MDKKAILAFILIGLIIILYPYYLRLFSGPEQRPVEEVAPTPGEQKVAKAEPAVPNGRELAPPFKGKPTKEVVVDTDLYQAVFTTRGGGLKSWRLKQLPGPDGDRVELIPPEASGAPGVIIPGEEKAADLSSQRFQTNREGTITLNADRPSDSLSMHLDLGRGRSVTKKFVFYNHLYSFDLEVEIFGFGDQITTKEYQIRWQPGLLSTEADLENDMNYAKAYALMGGELEEINADGDKEVKKDLTGDTAWIAARTKYFIISIIPAHDRGLGIDFRARRVYEKAKDWEYNRAGLSTGQLKALTYLDRHGRITLGEYQALNPDLDEQGAREEFKGLIDSKLTVPGRKEYSIGMKMPLDSSRQTEHDYLVYLGPLDYEVIKEYGVGLEEVMYRGFGSAIISPISKLIVRFLVLVHRLVPNYGLVIIIFSVLMKVIFHPLTRKQLEATKSMQDLQPKLAALKEKYKNDPQRLNRETMALYKKHGFNPLGGCLPLLLQLPILYALFVVFRETIELRGAEFIAGWINDLSLKDPYYILPGVMAVSMFVQQKMTIKDPKQAAMAYIMPAVLFFLFKGFASGLVLYWTMFNILSIGHQLIVQRKEKKGRALTGDHKRRRNGGDRRRRKNR